MDEKQLTTAFSYMDAHPMRDTHEEGGSFSDYLKTFSSVGMIFTNPELYGQDVSVTNRVNFDINKYSDELATMTDDEYLAVIGSRTEQEYLNRKERRKLYKESMEKIEDDHIAVQLAGGLAASLIDPVNLVPVGGAIAKANALIKTSSRLSNMAKMGAVVGTVGAVSNLASEKLMEEQGLPNDYMSAALFGFALGGGLGALSGAFQKTGYQTELAEALRKDDIATKESIEVQYDPTITTDPGNVPRIEGWKALNVIPDSVKTFFRSSVMTAYQSKNQDIRNIIGRLANPTEGYANGFTVGTTMANRKDVLNGLFDSHAMDIKNSWAEAREKGYTGKLDDFMEDVGKEMQRLANAQTKAVKGSAEYKALQTEHKKILDEFKEREKKVQNVDSAKDKKKAQEFINKERAKAEADFKQKLDDIYAQHMPTEMSKGASTVRAYMKKMLDIGKQLKIPELARVSDNKLYFTRQWDFDSVRHTPLEDLKSSLIESIQSHPANDKLSKQEIVAAASGMANKLKELGFNAEFNDLGIFKLDNGDIKAGKHLQGRSIELDTDVLEGVMKHHAGDVMSGYNYWMAPQYALRQTFPELQGIAMKRTETSGLDEAGGTVPKDSVTGVFKEKYLNKLEQKVHTDQEGRELRALSRVLDDLMGFRRMANDANAPRWIASRMTSHAIDMTSSGMFGLVQAFEIPAIMFATRFNRIFASEFGTLFKDVHKAIASDKTPNNKFINELISIGRMGTLLDQHGINRIADSENAFNIGKVENNLMGFNQKIFKYVGMRTMTGWLEAMTASNASLKMFQQDLSKMTPQDVKMFSRWGLNKNDLKVIQAEMKNTVVMKNGFIQELGLEKMTPKMRDKVSTALNNAVTSGVIQGDSLHVPDFLVKANPFTRLLLKYMRFPITANEVLLQRGLSEDAAGWAATSIASMMMVAGMRMLVEEAEVAAGIRQEHQRRYGLDTDEHIKNTWINAMQYTGTFGLSTTAYDMAMIASDNPQLGRRYSSNDVVSKLSGPAGDLIGRTVSVAGAMQDGTFTSTQNAKDLKRLILPAQGFPILGQGANYLIEQNTYKQ